MLALLLVAGTLPFSAAASDVSNCYAEVASVDYSGWSDNLAANRFKHVFQDTDEYPYFKDVGPAFVGIRTARYWPDGIVLDFSYWNNLDGRKGVGAEGHYSLIEDIRGKATFSGVSLSINVHDEFAFFLYDRTVEHRANYYAHVAEEGLLDVMTTTPNGADFIDVVKSHDRHISGALRLWSARFQYYEDHMGRHFEWNDRIYEEKPFRTIFFVNSSVKVGGVEHKQRKICRHGYSPLVVTNSDRLLPAIEKELRKRGELVHVWTKRRQ